VAVEDKGLEGFGRIRMQRIPNASGESLTGFIAGHIVPGGEIRTDAASSQATRLYTQP